MTAHASDDVYIYVTVQNGMALGEIRMIPICSEEYLGEFEILIFLRTIRDRLVLAHGHTHTHTHTHAHIYAHMHTYKQTNISGERGFGKSTEDLFSPMCVCVCVFLNLKHKA